MEKVALRLQITKARNELAKLRDDMYAAPTAQFNRFKALVDLKNKEINNLIGRY